MLLCVSGQALLTMLYIHLTCRSQPKYSATTEVEQVAGQAIDQKEVEAPKKQAFTSITGLPDKAAFEKAIGVLITRSEDCLVCVIAIDLVGFTYCNTAMGHGGGDVVLINLSSQFKALCETRASKASWRECAAYHNGGNEFTMICSPPDLPALKGFVVELAKIEFIGTGSEPGHVGEKVHSWVCAGAVVRLVHLMQTKDDKTGQYVCIQEAGTLEGVLSTLINLPHGEGAPALATKPWLKSAQVNKRDVDGCENGGNYFIWSKLEAVDVTLLPKLCPTFVIDHSIGEYRGHPMVNIISAPYSKAAEKCAEIAFLHPTCFNPDTDFGKIGVSPEPGSADCGWKGGKRWPRLSKKRGGLLSSSGTLTLDLSGPSKEGSIPLQWQRVARSNLKTAFLMEAF